jgi:hypothetical protein
MRWKYWILFLVLICIAGHYFARQWFDRLDPKAIPQPTSTGEPSRRKDVEIQDRGFVTLLDSLDRRVYLNVLSLLRTLPISDTMVMVTEDIEDWKKEAIRTLGAQVVTVEKLTCVQPGDCTLLQLWNLPLRRVVYIDSTVYLITTPLDLFATKGKLLAVTHAGELALDILVTSPSSITYKKLLASSKRHVSCSVLLADYFHGSWKYLDVLAATEDEIEPHIIGIKGPLWTSSSAMYQYWRSKMFELNESFRKESLSIHGFGYIPLRLEIFSLALDTGFFDATVGVLLDPQFSPESYRYTKAESHQHSGHRRKHTQERRYFEKSYLVPERIAPNVHLVTVNTEPWKTQALHTLLDYTWVYVTSTNSELNPSNDDFFMDMVAGRIEPGKTVYMDCNRREWIMLQRSYNHGIVVPVQDESHLQAAADGKASTPRRVEGIVELFLKSDMSLQDFETEYSYLVVCV